MTLLTAERLDELARAANAAPSADNRHVFRLAVDGDALCMLAADALHAPPAHRRLLALISAGAAMENIVLRGARIGLALQPTLEAEITPGGLIARLEAHAATRRCDDPLEGAIEHRHSNRRLHYRPSRLLDARLAELAAQAAVVDASLERLDTAPRRRAALALLRAAESERFRNRVLHRELFDSIRFDVGWRASAEQGLPPGALGLPLLERLGFVLLKYWAVQRLGNVVGLHRLAGFRGADLPCRLAPHLAAITTAGAGDHEAVRAGRALQRVWLRTTALGLSCQVFAAPGIYAQEVASDVRPSVRSALRQGWLALCPARTVWMIMRFGDAAMPPVHAARLPASALWHVP